MFAPFGGGGCYLTAAAAAAVTKRRRDGTVVAADLERSEFDGERRARGGRE